MRANGAKRVEAFAARKLDIAFLNIARRHVVQAGVAEDVSERVIRIAELRATTANYDRKLAFMLYALRVSRQNDRLLGTNDGRRRLEEHHGLFRNFVAEFRRVSG